MVKKLKFSKSVRHGHMVCLRGDKYIRCGGNMRPVGVYKAGGKVLILTDSGLTEVISPSGIVISGPCEAMVARV